MNNAEKYASAHNLQIQDAGEVIEEFEDEIRNMHGRCIDIGCGPGVVTKTILLPKLPYDATVVGCDVLNKMIKIANINYKNEERLSFTELNIETDRLPSNFINAFDNVFSFYCLNWCQNLRGVFQNIYQMMKPGGQGLILMVSRHNIYDSYVRLHDDPQYYPYTKDVIKYIPHFHNRNDSRSELQNILEQSGFQVIHCSNRQKLYKYNDIQDLKNHMTAVNPFTHRMPEDIQRNYEDDLIHDVARKMLTINGDNDTKENCNLFDSYYALIALFKKPIK